MRHAEYRNVADVERLECRQLLSGLPAAPPPEKFVLPIGGRPQVDWAVTAYTDLDPAPVTYRDYRGRQYTIDGNDSLHFGLPDFAAMDRGVDVYAAAGGTVLEVHDGEYDRHVGFYDAPPAGTPDNYVLIDHGGGWQTRYGRLRNGSVAVSAGQVVTAGQKIAQVGGSGTPSPATYSEFGAVLRFTVTHDGTPVETYLDPQAFWQAPLPFAGDTRGVHEMFTTNSQPTSRENAEHISRKRVFHPGERVFTGTKWHGINREVPRQNRFYRPDGTLAYADTANTSAVDIPMVLRQSNYLLPVDAPLGEWQVSALLDGVEVGRTSFRVAEWGDGLAEMNVRFGDNFIIDGRTTPIDYGTVERGAGAPWRLLTAINHGTAPLELRSVSLPEGFRLVSGVPATIDPQGGQDVIIQMDDQVAGTKSGRVTIHTNDTDNEAYDFAVKGAVTGPPVVVQVFVDGTNWRQSFRDFLGSQQLGSARLGFPTLGDTEEQAAVIPWSNVDRVSVQFDQDVPVRAEDLAVAGAVSGLAYGQRQGGFTYDPATYTATWTLDKPLANFPALRPTGDRVTLTLNGGGLEFENVLQVVPGDVNRNGNVGPTDFGVVRSGVGRNAGDVGATPREYTIYKDVNGDGAVSPADLGVVRGNMAGAVVVPMAVVGGARRETESDGEELFGGVPIL